MPSNLQSLLRGVAQRVLERMGLLDRARASCLYDIYWRFVDPGLLRAREREVELYRTILGGPTPGQLFFDIGANQGAKTDVFLRLGARVVAVDPDERNQRVLNRKFQLLRLRRLPVTIVSSAVAESEGVATLWVDEPGSGKNTLSEKWVDTLTHDASRFGERLRFESSTLVNTTTMEQLIERYGEPFFTKIDVEGAELRVLRGLQRPVRYLSFEVNLPDFLDDGLECVSLLQRLSPVSRFNYIREVEVALPRWLPGPEFATVLRGCSDASIEVMWQGK